MKTTWDQDKNKEEDGFQMHLMQTIQTIMVLDMDF
jgi:hypothetical protein